MICVEYTPPDVATQYLPELYVREKEQLLKLLKGVRHFWITDIKHAYVVVHYSLK